MTEQEIKAGLESLTKEEIIDLFPSLDLKMSEKKSFLIGAVLGGEPTSEEKDNFKAKLAEDDAAEEKQTQRVKLSEENSSYIVVHAIKEDGILYKPGGKYFGKYPEKFIGNQIRIRE